MAQDSDVIKQLARLVPTGRFSNWVVVAGISTGISALGQPSSPRFEVASIKQHVSGTGANQPVCSNNRFSSRAYPLITVISWAYGLKSDAYRQLFEKNPTISRDYYYDIEAVAERTVTVSECRSMVQALLAERFKLAVHWEPKDAQVSELVVAPGGPKLQEASETDVGTGVNLVRDGQPMRPAPRPNGPAPKGWTLQELAERLSERREFEPIIDKTGLTGRYKIDLRYDTFVPQNSQRETAPDLETALVRQLGLRLEKKRKGSVEVLVLDHIEPPSPN